jgi:hypothetical protein
MNRSGQVMLLTVLIVSGAIVGATTIAGLLMLYEMRQATNFSQSLQALFAADSGLEWKLYQLFHDAEYPPPAFSPEAQADVVVTGDAKTSIRSLGCAGARRSDAREGICPRPVNRALELVFD